MHLNRLSEFTFAISLPRIVASRRLAGVGRENDERSEREKEDKKKDVGRRRVRPEKRWKYLL